MIYSRILFLHYGIPFYFHISNTYMRTIKFRAWAKYTKNLKLEYAFTKANEKYSENYDDRAREFAFYDNDEWYDEKDRYRKELQDSYAWEPTEVTLDMIYNWFYCGEDGIKTVRYGYELLNIMQYTWFNDSAWKEIYEGDIVEYLSRNPKFIVKFEFWEWRIKRDWIEKYKEWLRVIGNIFENPNLFNIE